MGVIVTISKNSNRLTVGKELKKLHRNRNKPVKKTLADFYGLMPDTYTDGLAYQKKIRNEWR